MSKDEIRRFKTFDIKKPFGWDFNISSDHVENLKSVSFKFNIPFGHCFKYLNRYVLYHENVPKNIFVRLSEIPSEFLSDEEVLFLRFAVINFKSRGNHSGLKKALARYVYYEFWSQEIPENKIIGLSVKFILEAFDIEIGKTLFKSNYKSWVAEFKTTEFKVEFDEFSLSIY